MRRICSGGLCPVLTSLFPPLPTSAGCCSPDPGASLSRGCLSPSALFSSFTFPPVGPLIGSAEHASRLPDSSRPQRFLLPCVGPRCRTCCLLPPCYSVVCFFQVVRLFASFRVVFLLRVAGPVYFYQVIYNEAGRHRIQDAKRICYPDHLILQPSPPAAFRTRP